MLKNVIFDFGGVVYEYVPDYLLGCFFHNDEDRALAKSLIYRRWPELDAGTIDYDQYAEETVSQLPERLCEAAHAFFYNWFRVEPPIEQTWALIARLKARGYGIYLLSNAPTVLADALESLPILKLFDGAVVSAPVQMVKPNADIFHHLLETYSLKAAECLFVDDIEANVEGARRCGLHGHVYADGNADRLLAHIEALSK